MLKKFIITLFLIIALFVAPKVNAESAFIEKRKVFAEHGNAEAQLNLGDIYLDGRGVSKAFHSSLAYVRYSSRCRKMSKAIIQSSSFLKSLSNVAARFSFRYLIARLVSACLI